MAYRHYPLTGDSDDYEVQITAANGDPTDGSADDANVTFASQTGTEVAKVRRGPRELMIKARFTGSSKATAEWTCRYWCYDAYAAVWHCTATFLLVHPDAGSSTKGSVAIVDNDPNASHGYIEVVSGVAANQVLEVMAVPHTW
jgi:hypothetical protein